MLAGRIAGVEVPDTRPIFLIVLAVHVVAALVCVLTGVLAMTAPKRAGRHPRAGRIYYAGLGVVLVTAVALAALRWPRDLHLVALGGASFALASRGVSARRRHRPGWRRVHIPAMGGSYVALLTAFYVDNGRSLPVWDRLPHPTYWLLPGLVGVPTILRAMRRHRVLRPRPPAVTPSGG